ncbi:hypothetical protein N9A94_06545 [Akkermansiaceae bacterium]|nr:hypothetical protein [Akkermansiaceae bacterium]
MNYFRAMAGLPANIDFSEKPVFRQTEDLCNPAPGTTRSQAARAAAMAHVNQPFNLANPGSFILTHEPSSSWPCFSAAAWNGARYSSLSGFLWGCEAIDAYMKEPGYGGDAFANREVGHRRWMLFSAAKEMAVGDVPPIVASDGQLIRPAMNVLYVVGGFTEQRHLDFVAWPKPGYTPAPILTGLWSLSRPGANFDSASVSMQDSDGNEIPLVTISRNTGFPLAPGTNVPGENEEEGNGAGLTTEGPATGIYDDSTLVWAPTGLPVEYSTDQTYQVTVSGITGAGPSSYSYQVTVINPNVLSEPLNLIGDDKVPSVGATVYHSGLSIADGYEVELSQSGDANWLEGAEIGEESTSIDHTSSVYDYQDSIQYSSYQFWRSGSKAFRLASPSQATYGALVESFELGRPIIPEAGAQVTYYARLGLMADTSIFKTQTSIDGGATWVDLPGSSVTGTFNVGFSFQQYSFPLTETGKVTLVRFLLSKPEGVSNYGVNTSGWGTATGVFIDDISVSSASTLGSTMVMPLGSQSQEVNINQLAGNIALPVGEEYSLRIRPLIGLSSFAWSQPLDVVVVDDSLLSGFQRWTTLDYPEAGGFLADSDGDEVSEGLEYAFGTSPLDPGSSPQSSLSRNSEGRLTLQVSLSELKEGIIYSAQWSDDLRNWTDEGVEVSFAGGVLSALAPSAPVDGLSFLRWKVSVIPNNE